ncbi:MAG TPA: carboxypeptidase regulatory-like domain-containing protein [Bryobacteraceae bacterium]|jgi:hypothetical protein|nr:carboxypeptidase regulatory-like domain-containing protein [Bryobacteraceae bacterium]
MCRETILIFAVTLTVWGQRPEGRATASIRGRVLNSVTGEPVPNANVESGNASSKTDTQGSYLLKDVTAGSMEVRAVSGRDGRTPFMFASRQIALTAGNDISSFDLRLTPPGQITGRVVDENNEPMSGMRVWLVAREYARGALRYVLAANGQTDGEGKYRITFGTVVPDRGYLVMVQITPQLGIAVPDNPALRKPIAPPTFYPGTTLIDAAQVVMARAGEVRERIDIPVFRRPALCIEGHVFAAPTPDPITVEISPEQPTFGESGTGGMYGSSPFNVEAGPDGAMRYCGLPPGTYNLTARQWPRNLEHPTLQGSSQVTLSNLDLKDINVAAVPMIPLPGEILWDGPTPGRSETNSSADARLHLVIRSLTNGVWSGMKMDADVSVPGRFLFDGLFVDDYRYEIFDLDKNFYLKEITYDGHSVKHEAIRLGSARGTASLRVVIASDGGFIQVKATDMDGAPVADSNVIVIPASMRSEAAVADTYVTGQTDQNGDYKSAALAPGKYYVAAFRTAPDKSPETIAKLVTACNRVDPVDIGPGATIQIRVIQRELR